METNPAHVTCHFPMDLKKENTDFVVQHINRLGQDSEILSCLWLTIDRPLCQTKPGYRIDENEIGSTVNVEIVSATEEHEGTYICLTLPADLADSSPCNFTLKDLIVTNLTSTLIPNFTSLATTKPLEEKNDEDGATNGIVIAIPVVLIVLICVVVIFIFKCRGRLSALVPKCAKLSEEIYHIEGEPLVSLRNIKSPTTTQPPDQPVEESVVPVCISAFQTLTTARNTDVTDVTKNKYLCNRAVGLMEKTGAVIITGPERSGKSTLGFHVMHHFVIQGFFPLVLDHPNLWQKKKQGNRKHVVLLDECKTDIWSRTSLKSMMRNSKCYIIFIVRSGVTASDGRENGLSSCLEGVSTVDLAKKTRLDSLAPESLFQACQKNDFEQVVILLSSGVDPNRLNKEGKTPLHIACEHGQADIVSHLLWGGSKVNAKDRQGCTPLHVACKNSYTEVTKRLIRANSDVNAKEKTGCTPLHLACLNKAKGSVKALLEAKACIEAKNVDGIRPLHMACIGGSKEVVLMLLQKGVDIRATDNRSFTPERYANEGHHTDVARIVSTSQKESAI